jgi:hypothetical protein
VVHQCVCGYVFAGTRSPVLPLARNSGSHVVSFWLPSTYPIATGLPAELDRLVKVC